MNERLVPIQGGELASPSDVRPTVHRQRTQIPETVARLAYETYAGRFGSSQSFERLHERGGFGWEELIAGLRGDMSPNGFAQVAEDLKRVFQPAEKGATDGL